MQSRGNSAAVHRGVQDIVQTEDGLRTGFLQQALRALARVDVTGDHGVGVGQQLGHVVPEQDLALAVLPADELGIKVDIVDARERMQDVPELLAELFHRQDIAVGVHPGLVQTLPVHQMVAHLVRRV